MYYGKRINCYTGEVLSLITYSIEPKFTKEDIEAGWMEIDESEYLTIKQEKNKLMSNEISDDDINLISINETKTIIPSQEDINYDTK